MRGEQNEPKQGTWQKDKADEASEAESESTGLGHDENSKKGNPEPQEKKLEKRKP